MGVLTGWVGRKEPVENMRRKLQLRSSLAVAIGGTILGLASLAPAAPIILQDYEPPGNFDLPFNLHPGFSGTSQGEATPTISLVTTDGAAGTSQSATFAFTDDPAQTTPTAGGWNWQIRFLPNSGGSNNTTNNPLFAADGYVGFYLKA